ncbi:hypothetical protein D3C78_1177870 [compost metagenome]
MAAAVRRVGEQFGDALAVVGKAAAGQHHAAAGVDLGRHAQMVEQGAGHPAIALQQTLHRRLGEQADLAVKRAAQQAGDQRIAVDQMHAAAVAQAVEEMAQQAPGRIQRRARRAAGVEEVGQICAAGDAHAGQAD